MEEGDFYKFLLNWEDAAVRIRSRGMTFLSTTEEVQSIERAIAKSLVELLERVFSAGDIHVSCSIMTPEGAVN